MNVRVRRLTMDSDSDSDSDSTENSFENGKTCTVRFRHREFTFERQIFLNNKRLASPVKSENSVKKICLQSDANNHLFVPRKLETHPNRIAGVIDLTSLYDNKMFKDIPMEDLVDLGYTIDFSCDQMLLDRIEEETRLHSSDESQWEMLQIGRISGSVFKDVCHSNSKYPSKQLMSRICRIDKGMDLSAKWKKQNYSNVRQKYERIMLNRHTNFVYRKCGLVFRSEYPQFCVAPDGIVECECHGRGTIEFYCPYEMRNEKMIYSLPFLNETDDYHFELQKDSNFYYKLQLHMLMTDTNYCDLVIWTIYDYLDIRIERDKNFLFVNTNVAKSFFLRKVLPDMFNVYSV